MRPTSGQAPGASPFAVTMRRCLSLAEGGGHEPRAPEAIRELLAALVDLPWTEFRRVVLLGTLLGRMPEEDSALIERLLLQVEREGADGGERHGAES